MSGAMAGELPPISIPCGICVATAEAEDRRDAESGALLADLAVTLVSGTPVCAHHAARLAWHMGAIADATYDAYDERRATNKAKAEASSE